MSTIICAWLCDIADTWERSQPFPIVMSGSPGQSPAWHSQRGDVRRAGLPQLIVRMGYGPEVAPTPRRSVSEVLL